MKKTILFTLVLCSGLLRAAETNEVSVPPTAETSGPLAEFDLQKMHVSTSVFAHEYLKAIDDEESNDNDPRKLYPWLLNARALYSENEKNYNLYNNEVKKCETRIAELLDPSEADVTAELERLASQATFMAQSVKYELQLKEALKHFTHMLQRPLKQEIAEHEKAYEARFAELQTQLAALTIDEKEVAQPSRSWLATIFTLGGTVNFWGSRS